MPEAPSSNHGALSLALAQGLERLLPDWLQARVFAPAVADIVADFDAHTAQTVGIRFPATARLTLAVGLTFLQSLAVGLLEWARAFLGRPSLADRTARYGGGLEPGHRKGHQGNRKMSLYLQDLRYAARAISARPGFSALVVLLLALGIGANSAMFSVVNGVLLEPLVLDNAGRVVLINERSDEESANISAASFRDWQEQVSEVEQIAAFIATTFNLTGRGDPERVRAMWVSPTFFDVLGGAPQLGVSFASGEGGEAPRQVMLSDGYWRESFGADPGIVGESSLLNGDPFHVVGVMNPQFEFVRPAQLWAVAPLVIPPPPMDLGQDYREVRGLHYLDAVGRLGSTTTVERAQEEMNAIHAALEEQYPDDEAGREIVVLPLQESIVGGVRPALLALLGAVGFVLLIACANIANLLLAQATGRQREIAVRSALGASRGRLVRQLVAESLLLAIAGGGLGLLLAAASHTALVALLPSTLPRLSQVGLDLRVVGFTLLATMTTGLLFGLAPALRSSRDPVASLKGTRGGDRSGRTRDALVVVELALALVLVVGAGLMTRSFVALMSNEAGFEPAGVLAVTLALPETKYPDDASKVAFYDAVLEGAAAIPGVTSVGAVLGVPFSGTTARFSFYKEGEPLPAPNEENRMIFQAASADYFRTMGIPLHTGRTIATTDTHDSAQVGVVNETFAERYFDGDPLGRRISFDAPDETEEEDWITIVGVVGDVRHYGYEREPFPEIYMSYHQATFAFTAFVVRGERSATAADGLDGLASAMRQAVFAVDPEQTVYSADPLAEIMSASVEQPRSNVRLLALFSGMAMVIAAIGVFGVMNFTVTRQARDLGIRMALGARGVDVLAMVMRRGMVLVGLGLLLGGGAALGLMRVLSSLLYGVSAADPLVYLGGASLLVVVAMSACLVPACCAARTDPVTTMRAD